MQAPVILHLFPTFGLGGQQRRFAELANGMPRRFRHHVVSFSSDIEAQSLLLRPDLVEVSVLDLKKTRFVNFANLHQLCSVIGKLQPSLMCTYNWGAMEAVMAMKLYAKHFPKLQHIHFEDGFGAEETPFAQKKRRVWLRRFLLRDSKVIVPSTILEKLAIEKWKLPGSNVIRIANGIDAEKFYVRKRIYGHTGPVNIGTVGALRPEKNIPRLISLFDSQAAEQDAHLTIIGDGPQMDRITNKVRAARRRQAIHVPGSMTNPEKAYEEFDIFAMTSNTEQMPLSLIEAMMSGLPVVATDVGDIADMVSLENRPFICPVGDDALLLESLERLIDDSALRERLGRANQTKAMAEFDRETMLNIYDRLWRDCIAH